MPIGYHEEEEEEQEKKKKFICQKLIFTLRRSQSTRLEGDLLLKIENKNSLMQQS